MAHVITFESDIADDGAVNEPSLFDDDDPFNLPPPLPPLSPGRDDDTANQDGVGDQAAGESNKKEPLKRRKVNRSPRPKLDDIRLCSDRGIPALPHLCDGIKFKGKGHEASDLKLLMQRYEYWAHRLFPKFPFVDVVEQVENLSSKKLVQNCIKRIRRGEEEAVNDDERSDTELGENNGTQDDGTPSQDGVTPVANNLETFGAQVEARDRMVVMTAEQQERIRRNREIALAKRKAAQEKQAEQDNPQTRQTDAHNQSEEVAEEGAGSAKDDDDTMEENLALENNRSVQANDVEMGDETIDGNTTSLEDGNEESGTFADASNSSPSAATNKIHLDGEDAERMNTDGNDLVAGTIITQSGSSVRDIDDGDPYGTTTDNDLFDSTKEMPPHLDDGNLDIGAVQAMDKAPLSCRSVDQSTSKVLNHEVHPQEGCKETSDTQPLEQAPDEKELEEPQSIEMETE